MTRTDPHVVRELLQLRTQITATQTALGEAIGLLARAALPSHEAERFLTALEQTLDRQAVAIDRIVRGTTRDKATADLCHTEMIGIYRSVTTSAKRAVRADG